jgi:UDP-D-galactose:(glucosyl)LPS alpha-1,6-D-galactosyltransferase
MNIVIAGYALGGYGGMETVCKRLVKLITENNPGSKVDFIFFNEKGEVDETWYAGLSAQMVSSTVHNTKLRRLHFAFALSGFLRRHKPDVVIALDTLSCYIANVARKLCLGRYPIVSWLHFSLYDLYKYAYILKADAHLVISQGINQQVRELGVKERDIYTVFNPVEKTEDTIPLSHASANFIYIGRVIFEGQKRVKDLLESLVGLRGDWRLHVVGGGEDLARCQSYAEELGIASRILWHGWQAQPWCYIKANIDDLKALLLTSAFEGLPMTLLEAMAHGVYCVSSDCPTGPADVIDGINGQLYAVNRLAGLTEIMQALVDGEIMIDQPQIKHSITKFYDESYYLNFKQALDSILLNYHAK